MYILIIIIINDISYVKLVKSEFGKTRPLPDVGVMCRPNVRRSSCSETDIPTDLQLYLYFLILSLSSTL